MKERIYENNLGGRLAKAREVLNQHGNQSQSLVAELCQLSREQLNKLEGNKISNVYMSTIVTLAKHYGVSIDYLMGLTEVQSQSQDVRFICEETGLKEANVIKLLGWRKLDRAAEQELSDLEERSLAEKDREQKALLKAELAARHRKRLTSTSFTEIANLVFDFFTDNHVSAEIAEMNGAKRRFSTKETRLTLDERMNIISSLQGDDRYVLDKQEYLKHKAEMLVNLFRAFLYKYLGIREEDV